MAYRCDNCGALIDGVICEYCGARNGIDIKDKTLLQTQSERICPDCHTPLTTHKLTGISNLYIDKCDSCEGIFFDFGELETLLKKETVYLGYKDIRLQESLQNNPLKTDTTIRYKNCPVCNKKMHRLNYQKRSGIIIDKCAEHGFWLDAGELRRIIEWASLEGVRDFSPEIKVTLKEIRPAQTKQPIYGTKSHPRTDRTLVDSFMRYLYGF